MPGACGPRDRGCWWGSGANKTGCGGRGQRTEATATPQSCKGLTECPQQPSLPPFDGLSLCRPLRKPPSCPQLPISPLSSGAVPLLLAALASPLLTSSPGTFKGRVHVPIMKASLCSLQTTKGERKQKTEELSKRKTQAPIGPCEERCDGSTCLHVSCSDGVLRVAFPLHVGGALSPLEAPRGPPASFSRDPWC